MKKEFVTMGEAAEELGIDRRQLRRVLERLKIATMPNPIDARQRLIERSELEQVRPFAAKKPRREVATPRPPAAFDRGQPAEAVRIVEERHNDTQRLW